jgi:hypothetical protein
VRRCALLTLALLAALPYVRAQDCADPTPGPRTLLKASEAVFVGTVTSEDAGTVRFRVTEALKGVSGGNFDLGRIPGMSVTDFEVGEKYLVFANSVTLDGATHFLAAGCGPTRPLKYAQALLEQARAEKSGKPVASVYGMVLRTMDPLAGIWDESYERPLPSITVTLRSRKRLFQAETDDKGAYAFHRLPPEEYQVSAELPPGLALARRFLGDPMPPFKLPRHSSFHYELTALPTGQIRGRVIGPDGEPLLLTFVELYRATLFGLDRDGAFASQNDGRPYEFKDLPPGDYVLVFNRRNNSSPDDPFPRTFYGDSMDLRGATQIHLPSGQQISNADIHVKNPAPTRKIIVQLRWGDRTPTEYYSPQVIIEATEGRGPYPFRIAQDNYALNLFLSARYTIHAQASCQLGTKGMAQTGIVTVDGGDTATSLIILTFAEGHCARN